MDDATTLLFDLPGFRVMSCEESSSGRRVVVMQVANEHACPRCGVLVDGRPYDVRESRIKDLPMGHRPLEVIWRKRRYRCAERGCPQWVFTERSDEVPPRHRLTARLRAKLESVASRSARALSDVAAEYDVSWWSVHRALVAAAVVRAAKAPPPVRMLGLDETRVRSVRWSWEDGAGWRLSNPWMTSFVDLDTGRRGWLLGLVPGRSGAAIKSWLAAQPQSWRDDIEVVALDPSAPFAAAVRRALPQATLVVDHWHLVRLANQAVTEVRQRVAREQLKRRGRKADPAWGRTGGCCSSPATGSPGAGSPGSGTSSRSTTRQTRSVPPGASRSGCASCSPPRRRTTRGSGCSASTTPCSSRTWPRPPGSRRPCRRGGPRSRRSCGCA